MRAGHKAADGGHAFREGADVEVDAVHYAEMLRCSPSVRAHYSEPVGIVDQDSEIVFFGTVRGLENDLVPRAGYQLKTIEAYGIQPKPSLSNLKNIIKTMNSRKVVKRFIDEFKPDVVIGTGGYICGPVFAAANAKKIPTFY